MKNYFFFICAVIFMTSCIGFPSSDSGSYSTDTSAPVGSGDLDRSRKSGEYYTKLNANRNSHLPKAKPYKVRGETYVPYASAHNFEEIGIASWYGPGFHGKLTANGEKYNQNAMTAAHKLLPFGTMIRVTNLENGRSIVVRINDRGPFLHDRIIDLSKGVANKLGMLESGTAKVHLAVDGAPNSLANFTPHGTASHQDNAGFADTVSDKFSSISNSVRTFFGGASTTGLATSSSTVGMAAQSSSYVSGANQGNFGLPAGEVNRYGQNITSVYDAVYGSQTNNAVGTINRYGTVGGMSSASDSSSSDSSSVAAQDYTVLLTNSGATNRSAASGFSKSPYADSSKARSIDLDSKSNFYSRNPDDFGDDPSYYTTASMNSNTVSNTAYSNQNTVQNSAQQHYSQNTTSAPDPYATQSSALTSSINSASVTGRNPYQNVYGHTSSVQRSATGMGNYYVQVATFTDKQNAENTMKFLRKNGMRAEMLNENGKYFVQVGPYSQNTSAVQVQNKLRSDFPRAFMITR